MKNLFIYVLLVFIIFLYIQPAYGFTALSSDDPYTIIDGLVEGDLYVAGGNVTVEWNITQDLIAAAGEVTILLFITFFELYAARFLAGIWIRNVIFRKFGRHLRPWMDMKLGLFVLYEQRQHYTDLKKFNAL